MDGGPHPEAPALREAYADWHWDEAWSWPPRTVTWRLTHPRGGVRYLKICQSGWHPRVADEAARMRWAAAHLPVPEVLDAGSDGSVDWLVTRAVPGRDATAEDLLADPAGTVSILARALRRFHEAPVADCPFDFRADAALAHVRRRLAADLIDPERDFHPEHEHMSASEAVARLESGRPAQEDLVVCHGDYCFPNVLIENGAAVAFLDLGELGVADRWWDLAVGSWSTTWNVGPGFEDPFLTDYGIEPDPERIAWYRLLYDLAS
jgi:kanamycin kinase